MSAAETVGAHHADVIVIGAGVVGSAAAYELCRAGARTMLLERTVPNRESSGTTAGNIHIQAIHALRPGQDVPIDEVYGAVKPAGGGSGMVPCMVRVTLWSPDIFSELPSRV